MCRADKLGYFKGMVCLKAAAIHLTFFKCSSSLISHLKCQTFHIICRQQIPSCVRFLSFTDTACPWVSIEINALFLFAKNTTSKQIKTENLITSSHRWTVALSGYEAMYVLSSVIGLFVKESTSLCSNKPVSLAGLEQRAESILVYLTSEQINCNAD